MSTKGWAIALAVAIGFGSAVTASRSAEPTQSGDLPDRAAPSVSVLLVTLDTTRADRIGAYGYGAAKTPTLDRLAREGVLFEAALAPTPVTLPSHASILTGLYPTAHGVRDNGAFALPPDALLLSEVLRDRGWRTGAFVGAYVLDPKFGLDQGFEVYRAPDLSNYGSDSFAERRADDVVADAIQWFKTVGRDERFFAWVHLYDPHSPYDPPEPWRGAHEDPYDGEIAFSDSQVDRLLDSLERRGLADNLLVAVTSDHGESFGEHGEDIHGILIYEATLRVPLILSGPVLAEVAGARVPEPVSVAALPSTLLTLAGIPLDVMPAVQLPALLSSDGAPRAPAEAIYSESLVPFYTGGWHAFRGLRQGPAALIEGRSTELYDLEVDPAQLDDLASERPQRVGELRSSLNQLVAKHASTGWNSSLQPTAKDRRLLASLGYTVGTADGSGPADPFDTSLTDPKVHLREFNEIGKASELLVAGQELQTPRAATAWKRDEQNREAKVRYEQARAKLAAVLESSPNNAIAIGTQAIVEKRLGRHEEAVRLLERLLSTRPHENVQRYRLATSYAALGRLDEAASEVRKVLIEDPDFSAASEWMIRYHIVRGELNEAMKWADQALQNASEGSARKRELTDRIAWLDSEMKERTEDAGPSD